MSILGETVSVKWLDAWADWGETTNTDWKDDCPMTTYGVCVREGDVLSVAGEVVDDGRTYRAVTHIPSALVREIRILKDMADVLKDDTAYG